MPKPEQYPDITRPGDPGFTSFPKLLPDDCVQYIIYVLTTPVLSPHALRSRLLEIQRAAKALCKSLLSGYIWQREAFSLELINSVASEAIFGGSGGGSRPDLSEQVLPPRDNALRSWHLSGKTAFGDSIADEWLIVYLLRELSKQFQDAWVRVIDSDGEFLLVEAANVLPKWLNPEVAEHRVWINKGQLRVIPRELSGGLARKTRDGSEKRTVHALPREISLDDALAFIAQNFDSLIHSPLMEEEAFYRIRNYPTAIAESMHTALITVPRSLVYILHRTPAHISAAIEAFYLRDPISLRPLQAKAVDRLRFPPEDLVTVSVKFPRVGYAQLKSQEFLPPPAWLSPLRNVERTNEWARRDLGMKVACGFEMLVGDPQNKDKRAVREIELLLEDIASEEEELPSDEEIKEWPRTEDDEGWLDVNFEEFERELSGEKRGQKSSEEDGDTGFGEKSAQENLRRMVERFEQFLNDDNAGIDGAELSDEMDYDDDDDEDEGSQDPGEDREVSFDEEEFADMMRQMMGITGEDGASNGELAQPGRVQELDSDADSEGENMQEVMRRMENELREAGALNLNRQGEDGDDSGNDPQYHLAKNLLESFKSQVGTAGPTSNLMGSLGFRLPRHEDEK